MNYRHAFHAGNFADVLKHAVLVALIERLKQKPAAFCLLDSHAGAGMYDLGSEAAAKTGEWQGGIGRLWTAAPAHPLLQAYLGLVRRANEADDGALRLYPGSPWIARALLRPHDRLVVNELHPEDAEQLRVVLRGDRRVQLHRRDAYEALGALLPPAERRGLVLIDPPYEERAELVSLADSLAGVHRRWPTGLYAVWYPIKERKPVDRFLGEIANAGIRKILLIELAVEAAPERLAGCGMLLINPPWQLDLELAQVLPELNARLAARSRLEWLVPE